MKNTKVKGSILLTASISFIIVSLMTGCLVVTGQITNTSRVYVKGQQDGNNIITAGEICTAEAAIWLTRVNLEAINSPIKGDQFYNVLLEQIKTNISGDGGKILELKARDLLSNLPMHEIALREEFLKGFGNNGLDFAELSINSEFLVDEDDARNIVNHTTGDVLYLLPVKISAEIREGSHSITYSRSFSGFYITAIYEESRILLQLNSDGLTTDDKEIKLW